jgi:hypothetical protein
MSDPNAIPYASTGFGDIRQAQDDSHINVLVICHYIACGLLAFFSLFPLIYVGLGIAFLTGSMDSSPNPQPSGLGFFFVAFGGILVLIGETIAVLNFVSARMMSKRRGRTLSLVVAGINCIWVPIGTVLGVFTFIVLLRQSVAEQYRRRASEMS